MSARRIGFLNPWKDKAENQAFGSLRTAAERIGHELIHLTTSGEILEVRPDFVLAVASTQPKTTDIPTFGVIHEPRSRFWERPEYFHNLLSYDGWLTISDTLEVFLKNVAAGFGRDPLVGRYYNSPQRQTVVTDIGGAVGQGRLALAYFGTNWDPRSRPMFRELSKRDYMRIYGPEGAWDYLKGRGYYGSPPFDGESVQRTYARCGAGLAVLSKNHTLDDIISNRIFEITSVGAAAICPDIPWIRRWFGGAVWYYDPFGTVYEISTQIDAAMAQIAADPVAATARAADARAVFEREFCGEVLLANAVDYFERWRARPERNLPASDSPLIDVIVRVGGRPVETVLRAVRSIDGQSAGRFRVIFVRYKPLDLSAVTEAVWSRIEGFAVVDCFGGRRADTMTAGLRAVTAPYFACLDDDDYWLKDHILGLQRALAQLPPDRAFAYSGLLNVAEGGPTDAESRRIASMAPQSGRLEDVLGIFGPHSFLASSALLATLPLDDWTLATAEDSVLTGAVAALAEIGFSWRATACHVEGSEGHSDFAATPTRAEDVFEAKLRIGSRIERLERAFDVPHLTVWQRLGSALQDTLADKSRRLAKDGLGRIVLEEGVLSTSMHDREDLERRPIPLTRQRQLLDGDIDYREDEDGTFIVFRTPPIPWAYTLKFALGPDDLFPGEQWVVAEIEAVDRSIGIGVLTTDESDFITRAESPVTGGMMELWLHIDDPSRAGAWILQNWSHPITAPVTLRGLSIVRRKAAAAAA
jgi:phosphoglycerol transferase